MFIIHLTLYGHGRARPKGTADRHATQQRPISTSDATAADDTCPQKAYQHRDMPTACLQPRGNRDRARPFWPKNPRVAMRRSSRRNRHCAWCGGGRRITARVTFAARMSSAISRLNGGGCSYRRESVRTCKLRHAVRAAGNQGSAPVEPRWSARCPTRSRQLQWQALSGGLDRLKEDRELVRQAMKQSRSCTRFISTGQKKLGERAAHHPDRAHLMPRFEPTRWQLVQKYGT